MRIISHIQNINPEDLIIDKHTGLYVNDKSKFAHKQLTYIIFFVKKLAKNNADLSNYEFRSTLERCIKIKADVVQELWAYSSDTESSKVFLCKQYTKHNLFDKELHDKFRQIDLFVAPSIIIRHDIKTYSVLLHLAEKVPVMGIKKAQ